MSDLTASTAFPTVQIERVDVSIPARECGENRTLCHCTLEEGP
jgi:hypothetical protein